MLHKTLFNIVRRTISTNTLNILENTSMLNFKRCNICANSLYPHQNLSFVIPKRFQSKEKISKQNEYEERNNELELDVDDYLSTKKSKALTVSLPSLRMDVVAKNAFGLSRAKMEKEFYKSNIRINGQKCLKKSMMIQIGDEIDLILSRSPTNPKHLIVNRCTLVKVVANPKAEKLEAKIVQNKSLLIEEYEDNWHED